MSKPTVYIFMNKSLGMSSGKLAAQSAHAMALVDTSKNWKTSAHRTILIMQARDDGHIRNISDYMAERGFKSFMVVDEGVNEIEPHTITALATEVVDRELEHTADTFSTFELYKDSVRITLEVDR